MNGRNRLREYREGILLGIVALLWYGLFLGSKGLWGDELITVQNTLMKFSESVMNRFKAGHQMPLYYIFQWFWSRLAGRSEWALRFPSTVAAAASVTLCYYFTRAHFDRPTARAAALCLLLNQMHLWAAQNARTYAFLVLFMILCGESMLRMLMGSRSRKHLLLFWISGILLVSMHPVCLLILMSLFVALVWIRGIKGLRCDIIWWSAVFLPVALVALSLNAYLYYLNRNFLAGEGDIKPFKLLSRSLTRLVSVWYGEYRIFTGDWFKYLGLLVMAWALYHLWRRKNIIETEKKAGEELTLYLKYHLTVFFGIAFFLYLAGFKSSTFVGPQRYMIPALASIPVIQALVWKSLASGIQRRNAAYAFLFVLFFVSLMGQLQPGVGLRTGVQKVMALLEEENPPPAVFCCSTGAPVSAFHYYHYKGPPLNPVLRAEKDASRIRKLIVEKVAPGERFAVLIYKNDESVFRRHLRGETALYRILREYNFNKTDVWLIQRLDGMNRQNP